LPLSVRATVRLSPDASLPGLCHPRDRLIELTHSGPIPARRRHRWTRLRTLTWTRRCQTVPAVRVTPSLVAPTGRTRARDSTSIRDRNRDLRTPVRRIPTSNRGSDPSRLGSTAKGARCRSSSPTAFGWGLLTTMAERPRPVHAVLQAPGVDCARVRHRDLPAEGEVQPGHRQALPAGTGWRQHHGLIHSYYAAVPTRTAAELIRVRSRRALTGGGFYS
jgi:hypothetical protein